MLADLVDQLRLDAATVFGSMGAVEENSDHG